MRANEVLITKPRNPSRQVHILEAEICPTDEQMVASRSSMLSVGLIASTQAFTLQAPCAPTHGAVRSSSAVMEAEPLFSAETSRRAVLAALLGAGVGAGATPAFAGYVTNLGIETTNPKDADIDDEVLASKAVQDGLANIKKYKSAASSLKGMFDSDTAMNMIPTIRKEFDFSKVRDDLNVVSTVFDDTTQLTVDRVARGYATLPIQALNIHHRTVSPRAPSPAHRLLTRMCRRATLSLSQHPVRPHRARKRFAPQEGGDEPHAQEDRHS